MIQTDQNPSSNTLENFKRIGFVFIYRWNSYICPMGKLTVKTFISHCFEKLGLHLLHQLLFSLLLRGLSVVGNETCHIISRQKFRVPQNWHFGFLQEIFCIQQNLGGKTGQTGHLQPETFGRTAFSHFIQQGKLKNISINKRETAHKKKRKQPDHRLSPHQRSS